MSSRKISAFKKKGERVMKKRIVFSLLALVFIFVSTAFATEPVAPFLPFADIKIPPEMKAKIKAPSKQQVGVPVYPGARLGAVVESDGKLSSIDLFTKDSPSKVVAWYKKHLSKDWSKLSEKFHIKQLKHEGYFAKTKNPDPDPMDLMKTKSIQIMRVETPEDAGFTAMFFNVKGMKTRIYIQILSPF